MSSPETMTGVFAILEPHDVLTPEVIQALQSMFGEQPIDEIGAMRVHQLTAAIIAHRETMPLPKEVRAADVARALLQYMRDMEFAIAPTAAPAIPPTIKLITETQPRDMDLPQLLATLAENPSRYSTLTPLIYAQDQVRLASLKSPNWVIADGPKLDVAATLDYIAHLAKRTSLVRSKVSDGRRPTSLARLFAQEERPMLNPFALRESEVFVTGPFWQDYDLGNLDETRHLAYLWAVKTGHQAWPRVIDPYEHIPQAFAETPTGRWADIIEDYKAAKSANDPSTEGMSRFVSTSPTQAGRPFGGEPKRTDEWYREQLEQAAGRAISQHHAPINLGQCIVRSVRTTHASISLSETIVLDSIETSHSPIRGVAFVPRGAHVYTSHSTITPNIYELSWKQLYEKAVALGLIDG